MGFDCQGCGERWSSIHSQIPLCRNCTDSHRFDGRIVPASEKLIPAPRWREWPPTDEELVSPRIAGWLWRVWIRSADRWGIPGYLDQETAQRTNVSNLIVQWCPIFAPEEPTT